MEQVDTMEPVGKPEQVDTMERIGTADRTGDSGSCSMVAVRLLRKMWTSLCGRCWLDQGVWSAGTEACTVGRLAGSSSRLVADWMQRCCSPSAASCCHCIWMSASLEHPTMIACCCHCRIACRTAFDCRPAPVWPSERCSRRYWRPVRFGLCLDRCRSAYWVCCRTKSCCWTVSVFPSPTVSTGWSVECSWTSRKTCAAFGRRSAGW